MVQPNFMSSIGLLWILVVFLFITSAVLYLLNKNWWFFVATIAVVISQILIFNCWKDAKFGTIANVIILLVSVSAYGNRQFNAMVEKESKAILQNIQFDTKIVTQNDINDLPEIVQKWIENSGIVGNKKTVSVRLKQIGQMRTKPESKWMSFSANQYFNLEKPAFVWTTNVDAMPIIEMVGRDKLVNGEGAMFIKLLGLIPVVNVSNNEKINSGAMIRFLAEMCWFPSAALNDYITWEAIDFDSAKATLRINQTYVSGIFKFNQNGEITSFEANRYYGGEKNAQLEKWVITINNYKVFDEIKIPNKCKVTWKLNEGDFNWLNLEITHLEYNVMQTYSK